MTSLTCVRRVWRFPQVVLGSVGAAARRRRPCNHLRSGPKALQSGGSHSRPDSTAPRATETQARLSWPAAARDASRPPAAQDRLLREAPYVTCSRRHR